MDEEFFLNVTVGGGKYTVQMPVRGGGLRALRYGEPWRDCCGDSLIYELAAEVARLREMLGSTEAQSDELFSNTQACQEGWALFNAGEIQRLDRGLNEDGDPPFDDDESALAFVQKRAQEGSAYHITALQLHRRSRGEEPAKPQTPEKPSVRLKFFRPFRTEEKWAADPDDHRTRWVVKLLGFERNYLTSNELSTLKDRAALFSWVVVTYKSLEDLQQDCH